MPLNILFFKEEVIGLELPNTVELEELWIPNPGLKGIRPWRSKPAKLETGLVVQVPFSSIKVIFCALIPGQVLILSEFS